MLKLYSYAVLYNLNLLENHIIKTFQIIFYKK